MHQLFRPDNAPEDYNFEETCPHCDSAIPVLLDDNCYDYQAICPVCGEKIMLCTICIWDQHEQFNCPEGEGYCDWSKAYGCFRSGSTKHRT